MGKSALTLQYTSGHFVETYNPTIEDTYRKMVVLDGRTSVVFILDTAGADNFSSMRDLYMKKGSGFLLVFSLVSAASFEEIDSFLEQLKFCRERDSLDDVAVILVGNKSDLVEEREVSREDAEAKAASLGCQYVETSAKTKENVVECFEQVIRSIFDLRPEPATKKGFCVLL